MTGNCFDVEVCVRRDVAEGTECDLGAARAGFLFTPATVWVWGAYPKPLHVTDLGDYWQLLQFKVFFILKVMRKLGQVSRDQYLFSVFDNQKKN